MGLKNVGGSLIVNTLSSQFSEIMGNFLGGVLFFKLGARKGMFLVFLVSVIGSIGLIFVFDSKNDLYISIFVGWLSLGFRPHST